MASILSYLAFAKLPIYRRDDWLKRNDSPEPDSDFRLHTSLLLYPRVHQLVSRMSKTVQDLVAGTAGGIAQVKLTRLPLAGFMLNVILQVLVGQPFDIVKVVSAR